VKTLEKERDWLPRIAALSTLAVPVPLAEGAPGEGYAWTWSVYSWLEGENATPERLANQHEAAADLARFVAALQSADTADAPGPGEHNFSRGEPLRRRDASVRASIGALAGEIDVASVTSLWEEALRAPDWDRPPVWIHGDLDSRNLLAVEGRLSAAVDWGSFGVGDPACDLMVAWKVLVAESRKVFRDALSIDDATWTRARGWAVSQAVVALSYYTLETNAVLVREAQRWLAELRAEFSD
jgi:aminoglycoside phosphotransferase (APT) family kinase protein